MSFAEHRAKTLELMKDNSLAIVYAGKPLHTNEDDYYPFEANSQFFWLTGLEREGMALILSKTGRGSQEILFIEAADPFLERWTGHMPTPEEAAEVSGIRTSDIRFTSDLESTIGMFMCRMVIEHVYFDTFRNDFGDMPDYNAVKAEEFRKLYPDVTLENLHTLVCPLRRIKDAEEIATVRSAINITKQGLEAVMSKLKPGMMEYQVQAVFEGTCRYLGAKKFAFATIAGSGLNGCMMHYGENSAVVEDGNLILLDLGAKYKNYCSDITRTYPANGKYTPRQRQYYELVLKANRAVAAAAKPGITTRDLQELTCKILGEGLVEMGKIQDPSEVGKYYMHGVSHSMGVDCHDINLGNAPLEPGWIISDEPGLYIDEEKIGIRIEDDLLITEDGCECLSQAIIRDPDEIEAFMSR